MELFTARYPDLTWHDARAITFRWDELRRNTADNSSAQAVAHSRFSRIEGDPADIEVILTTTGDHVATGTGAQAMGSPAT